MPAPQQPLAPVAQAASSLRLRYIYDLANGIGLGLLGVSAILAAGNWRLLDDRRLLWLLLFVPFCHALLMGLHQLALRRKASAHFARLFAETHLALIILDEKLPGLLPPLLHTTQDKFSTRLAAVARHWRQLVALTGEPALPPGQLLAAAPVALGLLWATLTALTVPYFGYHPLTTPVVFLVLAFHGAACRWAIARDQFMLSLAEILGKSGSAREEV